MLITTVTMSIENRTRFFSQDSASRLDVSPESERGELKLGDWVVVPTFQANKFLVHEPLALVVTGLVDDKVTVTGFENLVFDLQSVKKVEPSRPLHFNKESQWIVLDGQRAFQVFAVAYDPRQDQYIYIIKGGNLVSEQSDPKLRYVDAFPALPAAAHLESSDQQSRESYYKHLGELMYFTTEKYLQSICKGLFACDSLPNNVAEDLVRFHHDVVLAYIEAQHQALGDVDFEKYYRQMYADYFSGTVRETKNIHDYMMHAAAATFLSDSSVPRIPLFISEYFGQVDPMIDTRQDLVEEEIIATVFGYDYIKDINNHPVIKVINQLFVANEYNATAGQVIQPIEVVQRYLELVKEYHIIGNNWSGEKRERGLEVYAQLTARPPQYLIDIITRILEEYPRTAYNQARLSAGTVQASALNINVIVDIFYGLLPTHYQGKHV